jgi:putative membrane protein
MVKIFQRAIVLLAAFGAIGVPAMAHGTAGAHASAGPTDPQIAHIAYTAGQIDIAAAEQALSKSHAPAVRAFAETMKRDHKAVNDQALALLIKLHVKPETNPTSASLSQQATQSLAKLSKLNGSAFDRAYIQNEVAFHQTVNAALQNTLIPDADNAELKSLLRTGLSLFQAHLVHAKQIAQSLR